MFTAGLAPGPSASGRPSSWRLGVRIVWILPVLVGGSLLALAVQIGQILPRGRGKKATTSGPGGQKRL